MKKILFLVVAMAAIFAFDSCKKSEGPADVAQKSLEMLKTKNYQGYADLVYYADSIAKDSVKLKNKKKSVSDMLEKNAKQKAEKQGEIKEYSVISEESKNDSTAMVKMLVVTTKNEKDTMDVKLRKDSQGTWKVVSDK